jgi:ribonucleotide reductase alpha subunit
MQAAVQNHYVDSSISKTINLPRDISFEAFKDVYEEAYAQGCKGCTTYRPNDVTGAVLEVKPAEKPRSRFRRQRRATGDGVVYMTRRSTGRRNCRVEPTRSNGRRATTPSTSPSTTWCRTGAAGPSRSSSTPRTWSTTPGRWR